MDRHLYETIREEQLKPSGDLKFVDLSQYSLTVKKFRVQVRRVNSREIYSSYLGMEVRLILVDAELCKTQSTDDVLTRRKNWAMKSVYRDADIRSLMQYKYHQRMSHYLEVSIPEFDDFPKGTISLLNDAPVEQKKLDKLVGVTVQPESDEKDPVKAKLKPEIGCQMYFECIGENYDKVPG